MARTPARRPRGTLGTVQQDRSGRFRAYYRVDGETFKAPRTFESKTDGLAWLAAERADRHRGTWHDPRVGQETLADYAASWLASRADLAPRTRDQYAHTLQRWIATRVEKSDTVGIDLGRYPLTSITPAVVRTWHAHVLTAANRSAVVRLERRSRRRPHPARAWGRANGFDVAPAGQISPALRAAWQAAGSPDPADALPDVGDENRDAGRTAATHAYRLLHAILATATRDGLLQANPCQIRGGGIDRHRERTIATPDEVDAIAAAFPPSLSAAVLVAAWSGLRYGELFGLARGHVDLAAGTVRVDRALVIRAGQPARFGNPKTTRSRRTVHLPGFVLAALADHLARHVDLGPDALLFTVPGTGAPVSSAYVSVRMSAARATIGRPELTWHDLRHTGATLAYRAGASVREVQNRLGHTTARAAAIYQHAADDSDRLLADRLDALRAAARPAAPIASLDDRRTA